MRIDGRKINHAELEQIRFAAVKAVQAGETATAVARRMGLYPNRLFLWLATYREGGWDALRARKASGRPKRLNAQQMRWIHGAVTRNRPLSFKLPTALWTRDQLRALIAKEFGIKLSAVSVGRVMIQLGLICQRSFFGTGSPEAQKWLKQKYRKTRAQAKEAAADVLFAHEEVVQFQLPKSAALAAKDRSSAVKAKVRNQTLLWAASGKSAPHFMVVSGSVSSDAFVDFLQRLMYQRSRRLYLLVTERPALRSVKVRTYVDSLDGRLKLLLLPSFSASSSCSDQAAARKFRMSAAPAGND